MNLCRNGLHEMKDDNLIYRPDRDSYECRACARRRGREYQRRIKAAYRALKEQP